MLKTVKVEDSGDTDMFAGSLVDMYEFEEKNNKAKEQGLRLAEGKHALLGITFMKLNFVLVFLVFLFLY